MNISVCMATYNGRDYINDQINSILEQLSSEDEIIVVDDCSTDNTVKLLEAFNDNRIKIYKNSENRREVYSFGRSMSLANNPIIFLSDQDDIWIKDRVVKMKTQLLNSDKLLISSNFDIINNNPSKTVKPLNKLKAKESSKYLGNIVSIFLGKKDYYGCAMAFKHNFLKLILPIPTFVESHDLWIAIAGNMIKSNLHLEEQLLIRRIHSNNVTDQNRLFFAKLNARIIFLKSIIVLTYRLFNNKIV